MNCYFLKLLACYVVCCGRRLRILVFDKTMQAVGKVMMWLSAMCAYLQNGNISSVLRLMVFGILLLLLSLLVSQLVFVR